MCYLGLGTYPLGEKPQRDGGISPMSLTRSVHKIVTQFSGKAHGVVLLLAL
jgi:hypothetical protein